MKHKHVGSALTAFTLTLGLVACGQGKQAEKIPAAEVTVTPSAPKTDSAPSKDEPPASDGIFDLNEKAEYKDGIEISLSKFSRGRSSDGASPENTPYIAFTVEIANGKKTKMDLAEVMIDCMTGVPKEPLVASEEIFDYEQGLKGTSDTTLLPGDQTVMRIACAMKGSESELQIDIAPDWESETATFHGKVK